MAVELAQGSKATMTAQIDRPDLLLPRKTGLVVIAWVHIVVAIGLTVLLVDVHFLRYWESSELAPLLLEAVLWVVPIVLLMVIGLGLLARRPWSRLLAMIFHWPLCVGSIGGCVVVVFGELVIRVNMYWPIAIAIAAVLFSIVFVSAMVLSYLHRRVGSGRIRLNP
jgi:hypothetical protein